MISIDQLSNILGYIAVSLCVLTLLAMIIFSIFAIVGDIKEKDSKKKYWLIKYRIYADMPYAVFCVKARSKAEAIYKFCSKCERGKTAVIQEVNEVPNE